MALVYFNNIPQPNDQLSNSQPDLLTNFASIQSLVDVNHYDFSSSNYGKHMWVSLPSQSNVPPTGSAFAATEVGLYNSLNPVTNQQELYINKTLAGPITVNIPATASILSTNATPASGTQGWTYLPSGILMKWGTIPLSTGTPVTITFPVAATIPAFIQVMYANVTYLNTTASLYTIQLYNYSGLNIQYISNAPSGFVTYFAIGY